ncbi:Gp138 family membrane-puncturing spike protein [Clostridium tetani]|uniref:Gp138 family membrane-puncturing spike protein n=1 Tax=Clostridium tetani TaxID=1513 RepID=UPI001FB13C61|nr:Gp138 family membrane-puncturing spike protein [Clostridium tetani]
MRNLNEILGSKEEMLRSMGDGWKSILRVACPGIIQSFNKEEQTVTVQLAIRELISKEDLTQDWVNIPILLDVPIVIPRAGGYCLTMPIQEGDECLVLFGDMCIDAWFTYGGIQNQMEKRRHDLSDGFAILGVWSQPNRIENYSTNSCQLRNKKGTAYIELKDDDINIMANKVNIKETSKR